MRSLQRKALDQCSLRASVTDSASGLPASDAAGVFNALPYAAVEFETPAEAVEGLAEHPLVTRCFVGQTYRFAQGSRSGEADALALEELEAEFDRTGGDVVDLFRRIALSERFRMAVGE